MANDADSLRVRSTRATVVASEDRGPVQQLVVIVAELQPTALEQIKETIWGEVPHDRIRELEAILTDLIKACDAGGNFVEITKVVKRAKEALE